MTNRLLLLAVVILMLNALASAAPDRKPHGLEPFVEPVKGIQWRTDYNAARKEAADKQKPLLIAFFLEGSGPCQKMEFEMNQDEVLRAYVNSSTIPLRLNPQSEIAKALGIKACPTIVLAESEGKIRVVLTGYVHPEKLRTELRTVMDRFDNLLR
jgi:thioredoxin-related protein